jgi:hypothetical protein
MPVRNTPADFVWKQHWLRASAGLRSAIKKWKGRKLTYVSHEFTSSAEIYGPLVLHREASVKVRDESGKCISIRPFRSLIEMKGRFKVFSFPK